MYRATNRAASHFVCGIKSVQSTTNLHSGCFSDLVLILYKLVSLARDQKCQNQSSRSGDILILMLCSVRK